MFFMHDLHGYCNLISGCVAKHSAVQGARIHSPCEKLFLEFMVCFSLLRCDLSGIFSMGFVVLGCFLGPKLIRENPLLLPLCMVYHGEYLLESQSLIPFEEMLIDTWVGHMYREILDLL